MWRGPMWRRMTRAILWCCAVVPVALAQQYPYDQPPPYYQQPAPAPSYQPPPTQPQAAPRLSQQDLSNLVAPIALYPDMLLSEVLAASTYPLELVQASQWMQANPNLHGVDLVNAAKQQPWDPSVQALVAFPDVMSLLTRDVQWTTDLGNAFLAQQADVMDAIQQLRASARANGRLQDTAQQRVVVDQQNGQNAIEIQPSDPQVVYPPVYNPAYVWGPPVYGAYPPLYYPASDYGIGFGVGTFLGGLFTGLLAFGGWGWGLSWFAHGLFLNGLFFSHFGFHGYGGYGFHAGPGYAAHAMWTHDPGHRLGVPYGNRFAGARSLGYSARSYSAGRGSYGSGYQSNRQAEAYRGLTSRENRGSFHSYGSRGAANSYGYRGGSSAYSNRGYSGSAFRGSESRGSAFRGSESRAPRSSASRSYGGFGGRSEHFSGAHSGGHQHFSSGGHGHSGGGHGHSGGGHSHGGHHK